MKNAVLFFLTALCNLVAMEPAKFTEIKQKINSKNQKLIQAYIIEKKDMLSAQEHIQNGSDILFAALGMVGGYSLFNNYGLHITAAMLTGAVVVKLLSWKHEQDCSFDTSPLSDQLEKNEPKLFSLLNGLSYEQLADLKEKLKIQRDS